jgi:hypothetical protein
MAFPKKKKKRTNWFGLHWFSVCASVAQGEELIVGTTHHTFPHTKSDIQLAQEQTLKLLRYADDLQDRMYASNGLNIG